MMAVLHICIESLTTGPRPGIQKQMASPCANRATGNLDFRIALSLTVVNRPLWCHAHFLRIVIRRGCTLAVCFAGTVVDVFEEGPPEWMIVFQRLTWFLCFRLSLKAA